MATQRTDAPPSYQTDSSNKPAGNEKGTFNAQYTYQDSRTSDEFCITEADANTCSKKPGGLTLFSSLLAAKKVRKAIRLLIQDHHLDDAPDHRHALDHWARFCASETISFSSILQEGYIEKWSPLKWAIVKRKPQDGVEHSDLFSDMLAYATQSNLSPFAVADVRDGCRMLSDNVLFQRLRSELPRYFAPVSGSYQVLLGTMVPVDTILVKELADRIEVRLLLPDFHKRLLVAGGVTIEFIAKSRIWHFHITKDPEYPSHCIAFSLEDKPRYIVSYQINVFGGDPKNPALLTVKCGRGVCAGSSPHMLDFSKFPVKKDRSMELRWDIRNT